MSCRRKTGASTHFSKSSGRSAAERPFQHAQRNLSMSTTASSSSSLKASETLLALQGVSKRFGPTVALSDVSLCFRAGEIHCLLGENGAGKSTVGKIAGGLYAPDTGRVEWKGQPQAFRDINDARGKGIGLVFQELSLAPDLSVRSNLRLGAEGPGHPFSSIK